MINESSSKNLLILESSLRANEPIAEINKDLRSNGGHHSQAVSQRKQIIDRSFNKSGGASASRNTKTNFPYDVRLEVTLNERRLSPNVKRVKPNKTMQ